MPTFNDYPIWNFARVVRGARSIGFLHDEENRDTSYAYEAILNGDGATLTTVWHYDEADAIAEILALVGSYRDTHASASGTLQLIGNVGSNFRQRMRDAAGVLTLIGSADATKTTIATGLVQTVAGLSGFAPTGAVNLLLLTIAGVGINVTSVNDNIGNIWTKLDGNSSVQLWWAQGAVAGVTSVTPHFGGVPATVSYLFREYNTDNQTIDVHVMDTIGLITPAGNTALSTATGTLNATGELVIGWGECSNSGLATNGYAHYAESGSSVIGMMEDKLSLSTAAVQAAFMIPSGGTGYYGVVAFKFGRPAQAGGGPIEETG